MDEYEKLIANSKKQQLSDSQQQKLNQQMKRTVSLSKMKLMVGTITIILMILPVSYIFTFLYYAFGTKSTTLMDVTSQTLYVTEPNTSLEEIEFDMEFSPFSMQLQFEQYKRIGKEDYTVNTYDMRYTLGNLTSKEVNSRLERAQRKNPNETSPWLTHPKNQSDVDTWREWEVLRGLPDETVVEAYISLHDLHTVDEIRRSFANVDVVWAAVDTGVEEKNLSKDGDVVSPIGYPVQVDNTTWSPFRDAYSNEQVFIDILNYIVQYEDLATKVSSHKNLKLQERIDYINKNGIKTYGVVVTGPKNEIEKLEDINLIRKIKLGEVKLWNWTN
ncbi:MULTISPECIES: anti-sigma factor [Solibacillus]|uniref:Anti sigma factor C-terminal domain-containing protein n=1 Tax=Solibacillus merdavium TaxID=2762218 RepID=A0ABR8XKC1_9BACL|nr:anti-sigma factor [Solibacillus merdavium]MBD8032362.1 anti sigma factor C-terminal domain-containing protein [Solibacillus merdavium]